MRKNEELNGELEVARRDAARYQQEAQRYKEQVLKLEDANAALKNDNKRLLCRCTALPGTACLVVSR